MLPWWLAGRYDDATTADRGDENAEHERQEQEAGIGIAGGRKLERRILKKMLNQNPALDLLFHALSDPTRRLMVERLSRGPASVSELARPLPMSLPAVVQHLQVLEASGLVRSEKVGRVRTCRIDPPALQTAEQWIAERRTSWEQRLDRLGDYLTEHPEEPEQRST